MVGISVIIPTYNRATALSEAIDSVLDQTHENLELIIVDDASTDETPVVVENYQDDRIQYHRFQENKGANAARNKGIELATGEYISFLDSDDKFHQTHLQSVIDTLNSETEECAGVFTSCKLVSDGNVVGERLSKEGYVTYDEILSSNVIGGFSRITLRSSIFADVGKLDEELQSSQDYDFFIRVLKEGYVIRGIDEILVTRRICDDRISYDLERKIQGTQLILEKYQSELTDIGIARLYYYCAFGYARSGDFNNARRYFKKSIKKHPTKWLAYIHLIAAIHPILFKSFLKMKRKLGLR